MARKVLIMKGAKVLHDFEVLHSLLKRNKNIYLRPLNNNNCRYTCQKEGNRDEKTTNSTCSGCGGLLKVFFRPANQRNMIYT